MPNCLGYLYILVIPLDGNELDRQPNSSYRSKVTISPDEISHYTSECTLLCAAIMKMIGTDTNTY